MIEVTGDFLQKKENWGIFIGNEKENYMLKCFKDLLFFWSIALNEYDGSKKDFKIKIDSKLIENKTFITKLEEHRIVKNIKKELDIIEIEIIFKNFIKIDSFVEFIYIEIDFDNMRSNYTTISNFYADIIKNSDLNDNFTIDLYTLCEILNYTTDTAISSIESNIEKVFKSNQIYPYFNHEKGFNIEDIYVKFFKESKEKHEYHLKLENDKMLLENDLNFEDELKLIDEDDEISLDDDDLELDLELEDELLLGDDEIVVSKTDWDILNKKREDEIEVIKKASDAMKTKNTQIEELIKERDGMFEEIGELNKIVSFYKKHYDNQFKD